MGGLKFEGEVGQEMLISEISHAFRSMVKLARYRNFNFIKKIAMIE